MYNVMIWYLYLFILFFKFIFLRPHTAYGSSQARGESELQLPAYITATATSDLSSVCDLYHSSLQRWILNPLSGASDWTRILMDASQVLYHWASTGTPKPLFQMNNTFVELLSWRSGLRIWLQDLESLWRVQVPLWRRGSDVAAAVAWISPWPGNFHELHLQL